MDVRRTGRRGERGTGRRWRLVRARTDAVPASVRRFNQRARRRRLRAAAPWLATLGVVVIVGLGGWVVFGTAVFGVDRVLVQGVEVASPDEIRAAAAIRPGTPLAGIDVGAVARRVGTLPPVRRARVVRDWPSTVVIQVVERTPVAAVPSGGAFVLVDASGVAFERVAARPASLPLVRLSRPGPGDAATRAALAVLAALTPQLRSGLGTLVADAPTRIRLEMANGGEVIWGDATDNADKARVATSLLSRVGNIIDVSAPQVVTVR